jgi:murein DD-endopeptidase MepM/ murein hydrolase activator NlpD
VVQQESKTLASSIHELDLTDQKLSTNVSLTEQRIASANDTIQALQIEINKTTHKIESGYGSIEHLLRSIDEMEGQSLLEVVLAHEELTDFWNDIENMQRFRLVIEENLRAMKSYRLDLEEKRALETNAREELEVQQDRLEDQRRVVEINRRDKAWLLSKTKSQEANYQDVLAEKKAARDTFLAELNDLESQLKIIIDQSRLPSVGTQALAWPLGSVYVTQYFGNTQFAKSGAYNGKGHNGIDFRASVGTPVYSSREGTIAGIGNTDQFPGCYSYGKWVLVTHDNGLSTLYAHLSLIKVKVGDYVRTRDVIGYSGNTGYSTGPHLHFSVYATEGVSIKRLGDVKKITNCANARIPIAPLNAYMNPLDFLPQP